MEFLRESLKTGTILTWFVGVFTLATGHSPSGRESENRLFDGFFFVACGCALLLVTIFVFNRLEKEDSDTR